jgi:hypothetical protein
MGFLSVVFALFTVGYILGVWTACLVFKQPQRAYEEGAYGLPADVLSAPVLVATAVAHLVERRS